MHKLIKIGKVNPKNSKDIKYSKLGLGFEKLDRDIFSPDKLYDRVAECGVKWARIQSGWQKTEREKGVYNFTWLDNVIDNFLERKITPWICLCYGNDLYSEQAKKYYGAVGCPPIFSEKEREGWTNYVSALVSRYKGKVSYFEIWNEPDGIWCWKHGTNPKEYADLSVMTSKAIRKSNPDAKIIGGANGLRHIDFLNSALKSGLAESVDFISFHEYTHDERDVIETVNTFRSLAKQYNPDIELIQGESGSQSKQYGHGALEDGAWTEEIQQKQLSRHTIVDLYSEVHFSSYFSCVDMVEALNGTVGDEKSYNDFGYFGVLGAEFDENGMATGEYFKKPSYLTYQNICSIFSEEFKPCQIPRYIHPYYTKRVYDMMPYNHEISSYGFEREDGSRAFAYWYPSNIMTTSYQSVTNLEIFTGGKEIKLIDVLTGDIYEFSHDMVEDKGDGVVIISEIPVKDTPLILTIGDFCR